MASVNQKHFRAGGGEAAVRELLSQQAASARMLIGGSQSSQQSIQPTKAQLANLRARVAERGKRELERQEKENTRLEAAETTYSGNNVYRKGRFVGTMVNGKFKPKTSQTDVAVQRDTEKYGNTVPEGSFGITKPPVSANKDILKLTAEEATQQPEAPVAPPQGATTAQAAATTPTQQLMVKSRPMNTTETIAAGKDPLHVWALANAKMIRRNQNQRQLQILDEAESASKLKKTSAEKVGWQGRTGMY